MTGKEKLYFLLNKIEDARDIAPSDRPLIIDPINNLNNRIRKEELSQLFIKLAKDEKVLILIKAPSRVKAELEELDPYDFSDDGCWHISLLPNFDRYFLEVQQEPGYYEFTGRKPVSIQNDETEIDSWLKTKDSWTLQKMWQVVSALNSEWQLRDKDTFAIPTDKFERARIKNQKDLEAVLTSLHNRGFIDVSRKVAEQKPSNDYDRPSGMSIWLVIPENPEIVRYSDTQIEIKPKKFSYLKGRLGELVKNEVKENTKQPESTEKRSGESFQCGELQVNLAQGVIVYKSGIQVEVSPDNSVMKLLVFLIKSNKVVTYVEIAKSLGMNCWHEGVTNKDVAREVQFLKRDLATLLKDKVGMGNKEIESMIIAKKNIGYKLRCV
ncbi:MAG TPA: hypothetical protein VIH52_00630 [Candidatus Nanoarchaeia archaeon]